MENTDKKRRFYSVILKVNREKIILGLILSLVLGISVGALQVKVQNSGFSDKLLPYLQNLLKIYAGESFFNIFLSEISLILCLYFTSVALAFFTFGTPFILILPFFLGLYYGVVTAYLYSAYGASGFLYNLSALAPAFSICAFFLILICKESSRFSFIIFKTLKSKIPGETDYRAELKLFIFRQLFFLLFIILAVVLKTTLIFLYKGLL